MRYAAILSLLLVGCGSSHDKKSAPHPFVKLEVENQTKLISDADQEAQFNLKWNSSGVESCTISYTDEVLDVDTQSESYIVSVSSSTEVKISCELTNGKVVSDSLELIVKDDGGEQPPQSSPAQKTALKLSQYSIFAEPGTTTSLDVEWSSLEGSKCELWLSQPKKTYPLVSHQGKMSIELSESTTVSLTCKLGSSSSTDSQEVTISATRHGKFLKFKGSFMPPIARNPYMPAVPGSVAISWESENFKSCRFKIDGIINQELIATSGSWSFPISISKPRKAQLICIEIEPSSKTLIKEITLKSSL